MAGQAPAGAAQVAQAAEQAIDVAALQLQVGELRIQLTGLKAQWTGLKSQLDVMLKTNPARPGVQQQWADVGVQIAKTEGDIARLNARIDQRQGRPAGTTTQPPGSPRGRVNPNIAAPAMLVMFMVLALPVSIAWARRIMRGKPQPPAASPDQARRLERIEQAVDTIAIEVERISEGQRFMTKLLAGRPARTATVDSNDSPLSDAAPRLALGAGPVEPIRVGERERVRQSIITPS
jgi:FtsZ-binding cell division protein ZapB